MDPILTAHLKAAVVGEAGTSNRAYEKQKLVDQRRKRGGLNFLGRMEADATSKKAFNQVCALRGNRVQREALDRALDRTRPPRAQGGPVVVTHDSKLCYEGQDRKMEWAPLEYY
mmetsp:Transcript_25589/g.41019  ORF Transcript_25589/g.41019 Transcript_25589/m.41019 type:complete len:114 (-) Transcript_25589:64-405(-)